MATDMPIIGSAFVHVWVHVPVHMGILRCTGSEISAAGLCVAGR